MLESISLSLGLKTKGIEILVRHFSEPPRPGFANEGFFVSSWQDAVVDPLAKGLGLRLPGLGISWKS